MLLGVRKLYRMQRLIFICFVVKHVHLLCKFIDCCAIKEIIIIEGTGFCRHKSIGSRPMSVHPPKSCNFIVDYTELFSGSTFY